MGWSSDSESKGTGFDSRGGPDLIFNNPSVIFDHFCFMSGSLFGHVGDTFSWILGCLGMCLGVLWGCFRTGLEGFLEKTPKMSKNKSFQICPGVFFQYRAARNNHF